MQLPSGSLGCPSLLPWPSGEPTVEWGYRILLGLDGQVYEYRADQDGRVVTCTQPWALSDAVEVTPTPTPTADGLVEVGRASLASDLGLSQGEVTLVDARPYLWEDFSLGCPQPGRTYPRIEAPGYSIRLRARGQVYELRVNTLTGQVAYCNGSPPTPTPTPRPTFDVAPVPTVTSPDSVITFPASALDRVLSEVAAEQSVSVGEILVESVESAESSRWAEQCRQYAGTTELRGSVAELRLPSGTTVAVYLAPDGSFVRCWR